MRGKAIGFKAIQRVIECTILHIRTPFKFYFPFYSNQKISNLFQVPLYPHPNIPISCSATVSHGTILSPSPFFGDIIIGGVLFRLFSSQLRFTGFIL